MMCTLQKRGVVCPEDYCIERFLLDNPFVQTETCVSYVLPEDPSSTTVQIPWTTESSPPTVAQVIKTGLPSTVRSPFPASFSGATPQGFGRITSKGVTPQTVFTGTVKSGSGPYQHQKKGGTPHRKPVTQSAFPSSLYDDLDSTPAIPDVTNPVKRYTTHFPPGTALDAEGNPTTSDVHAITTDLHPTTEGTKSSDAGVQAQEVDGKETSAAKGAVDVKTEGTNEAVPTGAPGFTVITSTVITRNPPGGLPVSTSSGLDHSLSSTTLSDGGGSSSGAIVTSQVSGGTDASTAESGSLSGASIIGQASGGTDASTAEGGSSSGASVTDQASGGAGASTAEGGSSSGASVTGQASGGTAASTTEVASSSGSSVAGKLSSGTGASTTEGAASSGTSLTGHVSIGTDVSTTEAHVGEVSASGSAVSGDPAHVTTVGDAGSAHTDDATSASTSISGTAESASSSSGPGQVSPTADSSTTSGNASPFQDAASGGASTSDVLPTDSGADTSQTTGSTGSVATSTVSDAGTQSTESATSSADASSSSTLLSGGTESSSGDGGSSQPQSAATSGSAAPEDSSHSTGATEASSTVNGPDTSASSSGGASLSSDAGVAATASVSGGVTTGTITSVDNSHVPTDREGNAEESHSNGDSAASGDTVSPTSGTTPVNVPEHTTGDADVSAAGSNGDGTVTAVATASSGSAGDSSATTDSNVIPGNDGVSGVDTSAQPNDQPEAAATPSAASETSSGSGAGDSTKKDVQDSVLDSAVPTSASGSTDSNVIPGNDGVAGVDTSAPLKSQPDASATAGTASEGSPASAAGDAPEKDVKDSISDSGATTSTPAPDESGLGATPTDSNTIPGKETNSPLAVDSGNPFPGDSSHIGTTPSPTGTEENAIPAEGSASDTAQTLSTGGPTDAHTTVSTTPSSLEPALSAGDDFSVKGADIAGTLDSSHADSATTLSVQITTTPEDAPHISPTESSHAATDLTTKEETSKADSTSSETSTNLGTAESSDNKPLDLGVSSGETVGASDGGTASMMQSPSTTSNAPSLLDLPQNDSPKPDEQPQDNEAVSKKDTDELTGAGSVAEKPINDNAGADDASKTGNIEREEVPDGAKETTTSSPDSATSASSDGTESHSTESSVVTEVAHTVSYGNDGSDETPTTPAPPAPPAEPDNDGAGSGGDGVASGSGNGEKKPHHSHHDGRQPPTLEQLLAQLSPDARRQYYLDHGHPNGDSSSGSDGGSSSGSENGGPHEDTAHPDGGNGNEGEAATPPTSQGEVTTPSTDNSVDPDASGSGTDGVSAPGEEDKEKTTTAPHAGNGEGVTTPCSDDDDEDNHGNHVSTAAPSSVATVFPTTFKEASADASASDLQSAGTTTPAPASEGSAASSLSIARRDTHGEPCSSDLKPQDALLKASSDRVVQLLRPPSLASQSATHSGSARHQR